MIVSLSQRLDSNMDGARLGERPSHTADRMLIHQGGATHLSDRSI